MTASSERSWHPAHQEFQFSDYGEWLDEGTTELMEDVARRAQLDRNAAAPTVPSSDCGIEVAHNEPDQLYGAWVGEQEVATLTYKLVGNRIVLWSATVIPSYRRHGVATELVAKALDDIRTTGKTITIICPVVRQFIDHYPQYEDLVDRVRPGVHSGQAA